MRIVLTGGGSGGHFYPLIAVAEQVRALALERKLVDPKIYFFGPQPFDERALYDNDIIFKQTPAGKVRRYFSIFNFFDSFKTALGILKTFWLLYSVYPDVIFSKGGYGSLPTLVSARILGIPVFVHDSDAIPGRGTLYAAPFAKYIAISYDEALQYFPKSVHSKIVLTGNPVRKDIQKPAVQGAFEFLDLDPSVPVVVFLGGSLGAETLNNLVLDALPDLLQKYQVIHQTGEPHFNSVSAMSQVILGKQETRFRYKAFPYLTTLALKMSAGAAGLIVSRAGSGSIAELALWSKPSILIPIPVDVSRDQRLNAFAYARTGACVVIEQQNATPHLLMSEVDRIFSDDASRKRMITAAQEFARPNAARSIAEQLLAVSISHTD